MEVLESYFTKISKYRDEKNRIGTLKNTNFTTNSLHSFKNVITLFKQIRFATIIAYGPLRYLKYLSINILQTQQYK